MEKFLVKNNRPEFDEKLVAKEVGHLLVNELSNDQIIKHALFVIGGGDDGEFNGNTASFSCQDGAVIVESEYHDGIYPYRISLVQFLNLIGEWYKFIDENKFKFLDRG